MLIICAWQKYSASLQTKKTLWKTTQPSTPECRRRATSWAPSDTKKRPYLQALRQHRAAHQEGVRAVASILPYQRPQPHRPRAFFNSVKPRKRPPTAQTKKRISARFLLSNFFLSFFYLLSILKDRENLRKSIKEEYAQNPRKCQNNNYENFRLIHGNLRFKKNELLEVAPKK